jgi:hypothetical protein
MNRIPRIAVFVGKKLDGVQLWRAVKPWTDLHRMGVVEVDFHYETFQEHDTYRYDVLYICHAHHATFLKLIEAAHLGGTLVWADLDDDLIGVPIHNQAYHTITKGNESAMQILQRANIVSVSTDEIAENYRKYMSVEPVVLANAIHEELIAPTWNENRNVLWRGNWTQIRDMWVNKKDQDILTKSGYGVAYIGAVPPWVEQPSWMEWGPAHSYFRTIKKSGVAFFWKPLEDNRFNRSKSNIAMLEGAMAGALTITNLKHERWKPAITATEAVERADTWKRNRFEQMREFIVEHYNAKVVNEQRYLHLMANL